MKLRDLTLPINITELPAEAAKELQEYLAAIGFYTLQIDGIIGTLSLAAFKQFKNNKFLNQPEILGESSLSLLEEAVEERNQHLNRRREKLIKYKKPTDLIRYINPPAYFSDGRETPVEVPESHEQTALSDADYQRLANEFNIPLAAVRAVIEVESAGSGFLLNEPHPARPKILFEGHWFYKLTPLPVSQVRPDLSYPSWTKQYYIGGSGEWERRLLAAIAFDPIPALMSASWGLGQVMGFNWQVAGCNSVEQFVEEAFIDEYHQARHMMNFIKNNNLLRYIRSRNWDAFAFRYNGSGYRQNNYHTKLANAFKKYL